MINHDQVVKTAPLFHLLVLGVSLVTGCHKTAMDTAEPEPMQEHADRSAAPPPATVTGVYLDPGVAALCDMTTGRAYVESDSAEPAGSRLDSMRELAACITSGPLQGRRLDLVGYTDPRGSEPGGSRVESVREALLAHGAPADALIARSERESGAGPTDSDDWTFGRRVEIRLAPRHGG
jgi:outer membrane protein OmpA-like peptidoglycan-associated protein